MSSPTFNALKKTLQRQTQVITANGTIGKKKEWIDNGTVEILIQPLGSDDNATLDGGSFSEAYKGYVSYDTAIEEDDKLVDGTIVYAVQDIQENPYTLVPSFAHKKLFLEKLTDAN